MKNREDFLKKLREDPNYKAALARARTPQERKVIVDMVESFVGSVGDILGPAIERSQKDPAFAARLGRALIEGKDVLSSSETGVSGSTA